MDERRTEALLADTRWLRRLTRGFVHDREFAEDVCQETLAAALRSPAGRERNWLSRVARNLATSMLRRECRRTEAESEVSEHRVVTPPDELIAEAELQRAAVDALMRLEEPYRRTLLLRFMKGLSVRAVAREMDVPVETVRTRQKRGLAQLRAALDRRPGGRLALVLPMAVRGWPTPTTAALWGFVIMKTKAVLAVAAVVLIAGLFGLQAYADRGDDEPTDPVAVAPLESEGPSGVEQTLRSSSVEREDVADQRVTGVATEPGAVTGSLVAHVTWKDTGGPAANVCVLVVPWQVKGRMRHGERIPQMVRTDEAGRARFETVAVGRAKVDVDRGLDGQGIEIRAGGEAHANFQLEPKLAVRGTVVDAGGRRVGGAEVLTMWAVNGPAWVHSVAITDEEGRFALRGLDKYMYLGARKSGAGVSDFALLLYPRPAADGVVEMELTLPEDFAAIRGVVVDKDGKPVIDAWVKVGGELRERKGGFRTPPLAHARTDREGRFAVDGLRSGACKVQVYALGHAPMKSEFHLAPFRTEGVRLRLQPGATLEGRVVDPEGRPVVQVDVYFLDAEHPQTRWVRTDDEGRFKVVDFPAGKLRLHIRGKAKGDKRVELGLVAGLVAGQVVQQDFLLQPGPSILGRLLDERGKPLVDWVVTGLDQSATKMLSARSDAAGRFRISSCEDRRHDLDVSAGWGFRHPPITVLRGVVPGATETHYEILDEWMPSAVIRGRVFDADRKPLEGAVITLSRDGASFSVTAPNTDKDGRFTTMKLPPGRYLFQIGHVRHVLVKKTIELASNEESVLEDVIMRARPKK